MSLRFRALSVLFSGLCCLSHLNAADQSGAANQRGHRPNVLIIMADDCTHNDLPMYGGENAKTPNLMALAEQSLVFNKAYLSEAMCQPCRAELYTGLFPMRNGCAWNHSASRPSIRSMPQHLGPLGYRVGLAGKVHVKPDEVFPFESVAGFDPNCVRNPTRTHDLNGVREFMSGDEQPFCLVVALVEPHVPWVMGDASAYPPKKLKLPPHIADTPVSREAFSSYLAEITYMDGQVGEILSALDAAGKAEETLVLFTSEQGAQFPGCKWTNWDLGVHTALMARWPGHITPGKRTDAIVQYADVLPTLLEIAGAAVDATNFDGKSFAKVLTGETNRHRQYAYGVHNNLPEGPAYPIRTITDGTYRYIRNLRPDEIYIEKHLMGRVGSGELNNTYWQNWVWDAQEDERSYHLVKRYILRPPEELYDTSSDPFEHDSLVDCAECQPIKKRLIEELDRWLAEQGDPGIPQDSQEALRAARQGMHLYYPPEIKPAN